MDTNAIQSVAMGTLKRALEEAKLDPEEFACVQRCVNRLSDYAYIGALETPQQRAEREEAVAADLATLMNISLAKGIDLETSVRGAVATGIKWITNFALRMIAPVVAAAAA